MLLSYGACDRLMELAGEAWIFSKLSSEMSDTGSCYMNCTLFSVNKISDIFSVCHDGNDIYFC